MNKIVKYSLIGAGVVGLGVAAYFLGPKANNWLKNYYTNSSQEKNVIDCPPMQSDSISKDTTIINYNINNGIIINGDNNGTVTKIRAKDSRVHVYSQKQTDSTISKSYESSVPGEKPSIDISKGKTKSSLENKINTPPTNQNSNDQDTTRIPFFDLSEYGEVSAPYNLGCENEVKKDTVSNK